MSEGEQVAIMRDVNVGLRDVGRPCMWFSTKTTEGKAALQVLSWEQAAEVLKVAGVHDDMRAYDSIAYERDRQETKWGEQNHHPVYWLGILTEELGEVAKVAIEGDPFAYRGQRSYAESTKLLREELVQLAAVAVAAIEHIDRRDVGVWHGDDEIPNQG